MSVCGQMEPLSGIPIGYPVSQILRNKIVKIVCLCVRKKGTNGTMQNVATYASSCAK